MKQKNNRISKTYIMLILVKKANRPATDKLRTKTKTSVEMSGLRVRNALACKSLIKRWKL